MKYLLPTWTCRARLACGAALLGAWMAFAGGGAHAQAVSGAGDLPALAQQWVDRSLAAQAAVQAEALRWQASVGAPDARLQLAPCRRVQPYLPAGSRLWGPSRVGLRCEDGPVRWNVFVPVQVKAIGSVWVLRRDVTPGVVLGDGDLVRAESDWAAEASPALARREEWLGMVATRTLTTGQVLRQHMVRAAVVFQAGAQVRVLVQGNGFQISAQGQALAPGQVGQPVRMRMDSGTFVTGTVLDARTVRVEL